MITQFRAERRKLRRRKVWLVMLGLIAVQAAWLNAGLMNMDGEELSLGYNRLLYNLPLINTMVMPLSIAMIASRICDIENKGEMYKLLYTLQRRGGLFNVKLLVGSGYLLLIMACQVGMILAAGRTAGFTQPVPWRNIGVFAVSGVAVSLAVYLIQQTLSLLCSNQIAPLALGLLGSFSGVCAVLFPMKVSRLVLWSYYTNFSTVRLNWTEETGSVSFSVIPFPTALFVGFLTFTLALYAAGRMLAAWKEV